MQKGCLTELSTSCAPSRGSLRVLGVPAVPACRGPHVTRFQLLGDGLERTGAYADIPLAVASPPRRAPSLALTSFAFDFARHFFQPHGIGRAGDQSAQLGGNRHFPRWLSFAVSLQLGASAAAQSMGGHVSPSLRHGTPYLCPKRASYSPVAGELCQPRKTGIPEGTTR